MVWWQERQYRSTEYPISSGELQDSEILANALAFDHSKAWVDANDEAQARLRLAR